MGATLNLGMTNIDPGDPAGTLDVFAFAGDGSVSEDEWDAGSVIHSFSGIEGGRSTQTVEISDLLASAVANGDAYLSFNLRTVDTDRYSLNDTIDGVTRSISDPTFIDVVPEPSMLPSFILGAGILFWRCRPTALNVRAAGPSRLNN